jgi:hypothetical protein
VPRWPRAHQHNVRSRQLPAQGAGPGPIATPSPRLRHSESESGRQRPGGPQWTSGASSLVAGPGARIARKARTIPRALQHPTLAAYY